jgi:GLTT repeat (6 copies)
MFTPVHSAARVALLAVILCVACESARQTAPEPAPIAMTSGALRSHNGIASNGIASNGIASNGIASNGIASNGIASNGIASNGMLTNGLSPGDGTNGLAENGLVPASLDLQAFKDWFSKDESYSAMVMTYVARCALAEGQSLSYTTATETPTTYAFAGTLGLAPTWASGQPIPQAEQELVSACLAAHTNRFGQHVSISVRGYQADGSPIAVTQDEYTQYTFDEACFFGNLFAGPGTFMALGPSSLDPVISTPRGCAAENGVPTPCAPMVHTGGSCSDVCTAGTDGTAEWASCTVNGISYRPIHIFLSKKSLNVCGDGVCQLSETADSCPADCAAPAPAPAPDTTTTDTTTTTPTDTGTTPTETTGTTPTDPAVAAP